MEDASNQGPSEDDMVEFKKLLNASDAEAVAAHKDFMSSKNEKQFYINISRIVAESKQRSESKGTKAKSPIDQNTGRVDDNSVSSTARHRQNLGTFNDGLDQIIDGLELELSLDMTSSTEAFDSSYPLLSPSSYYGQTASFAGADESSLPLSIGIDNWMSEPIHSHQKTQSNGHTYSQGDHSGLDSFDQSTMPLFQQNGADFSEGDMMYSHLMQGQMYPPMMPPYGYPPPPSYAYTGMAPPPYMEYPPFPGAPGFNAPMMQGPPGYFPHPPMHQGPVHHPMNPPYPYAHDHLAQRQHAPPNLQHQENLRFTPPPLPWEVIAGMPNGYPQGYDSLSTGEKKTETTAKTKKDKSKSRPKTTSPDADGCVDANVFGTSPPPTDSPGLSIPVPTVNEPVATNLSVVPALPLAAVPIEAQAPKSATPSSEAEAKRRAILSFIKPSAITALASQSESNGGIKETKDVVETGKTSPVESSVVLPVAGGTASVEDVTSASPKIIFHRTSRPRIGKVEVSLRRNGDAVYKWKEFRPNDKMFVRWEMPTVNYDQAKALSVALQWYGALNNHQNIIAKRVTATERVNAARSGNGDVTRGEIQFFAPKGAGMYVYRLFDAGTEESSYVTFGTSNEFLVQLRDSDVTSSLKLVNESFRKRSSEGTAFNQLRSTAEGIRNSGAAIGGVNPRETLNQCLTLAIDAIRKLQQHGSENEPRITGETAQDAEVSSGGKSAHVNFRLHCDAYESLLAVRNNAIVWEMTDSALKGDISAALITFCPLTFQFYESVVRLSASRRVVLGFDPAILIGSVQRRKECMENLQKSIQQLLPTLLPGPTFATVRTELRMKIQQAIISSGIVPQSTVLNIFGSSQNNFGSEGADMDMCLSFPGCHSVSKDEKARIIEAIAEFLKTKMGMREVQARSTARIPIVIFKDSVTNIDCDISFYNPLALSNTFLLRTYSTIDSRLREVAFVVKKWAKSRNINNPQEGTLSSYGYILCLINFFQSRSPPLLPNLQRLPPNWLGHEILPNSPPPDVHDWQVHPVDGSTCDTYFYRPLETMHYTLLKDFASKNRQTTAELLADFFNFFAWEFDYRKSVVSVRSGTIIPKQLKLEEDCWQNNMRLCVEDPFEYWYDVAHVIKGNQMKIIRQEFMRAHTLISRAMQPVTDDDSLPKLVDSRDLLRMLLEEKPYKESLNTDTSDLPANAS